MSQKFLAQWFGNLLSATALALHYVASLDRLWAQRRIVGLGSSPRLSGGLILVQRTSVGAEKSFRVNPSLLVNSGAVVWRIRAAKLSESELSQRDVVSCIELYVWTRILLKKRFLARIWSDTYVQVVWVLLAPEGAYIRLIVRVVNYQLCFSSQSRWNDISSR